jgi:cytochrome c
LLQVIVVELHWEYFMKFIFKILSVFAAALTLSCGGGSSTPSTQSTPQSATFSAAKYAGLYLSQCEFIPNAVNMEKNAALYARFYQTVGLSTTAVAPLQWRIDLYDTPLCSGSAIGYVENKNTANKMTIVGQATINGNTVDKVVVTFGAADSSAVLKLTPSAAEIGNAMRLSIPIDIFSAFEYPDLWYIEAGKLFEGGQVFGPDDFPVALDTTSPSTQLSTALPLPASPCGIKLVNWQVTSSTCNAKLVPSASGALLNAIDTEGLSTGAANFTCSNGVWGAATAATCVEPPVIPACQPTTFTWTVGANTCTGQLLESLPVDYGFPKIITTNTPGYFGNAPVACTADKKLILDPRYLQSVGCEPIPPPKPRTTDPLQLANEKNCMACHSSNILPSPNGLPLGLSFPAIANFYRNSPPAPGVLEDKIYRGGIGTFGNVPMPANSQVDAQDLAILVPWILSQ